METRITNRVKFFRVLYLNLLILSGFLIVNQASISQNLTAWQKDSSQIFTEHITFDLSAATLFETTSNVKLSDQGIQKNKIDEIATVISKKIEIPVKDPSPFLALGSKLMFEQITDQPGTLEFEIRYASQTDKWSDWISVSIDDHLTITPDSIVGTLQYLPAEAWQIQFRITFPHSLNDRLLRLRSLHLSFTSPGSTPTEILLQIQRRSFTSPLPQKSVGDKYPRPDFVPRVGWGSPDGQEPSGPVSLTNVTHQIVHHTAGRNRSSDWPAVVRAIWDYHVNTNGWSDIGYNWLIDPNGVIYQGRGWIDGNDDVLGAHFCGTNLQTMGLALMGNFENAVPTPNSQYALEELLAWKSDEKNINPVGRRFHPSSGLHLFTISGHRDGCSTLCPGENLYMNLPAIRENVRQKIGLPSEIASGLKVNPNFPNPFTENTTLNFTIGEPGNVRISIWNSAGLFIDLVANQFFEAQTHSAIWNSANFASGVYFYKVEYQNEQIVQKMILIR